MRPRDRRVGLDKLNAAEQTDAALATGGDAWLQSSPTGKPTPSCPWVAAVMSSKLSPVGSARFEIDD
jgi:hypothetical protein